MILIDLLFTWHNAFQFAFFFLFPGCIPPPLDKNMNLLQTQKSLPSFLHRASLMIQPEEVGFPIQPIAGCSALETFPDIRRSFNSSVGMQSSYTAANAPGFPKSWMKMITIVRMDGREGKGLLDASARVEWGGSAGLRSF